jgi:extracellular matrix protein 14
MRYFPNPLSFLCLLLVLKFCAHTFAVPWAGDNQLRIVQYQHAAKQSSRKIGNVFPQLTWLRNTAIEKVFGIPPKSTKSQGDNPGALSRSSSSKLPSTLLAKYGGDVVLRFNISTSEEEAALSQAADILFLDVWEFTNNWADIRLREDDVCFRI